jgi:parvulin-like peptidyl-prolyl isomerase
MRHSYPRHALAMAFLGLGACRPSGPADPVILALGEQVMRRSDFERHVRAIEARGDAVTPAVREALLDRFIEEKVLVLEAKERGLLAPGGSEEEEALAVRKLLESTVRPANVSEEEIAGYYQGHLDAFRAEESFSLRQILVSTDNEARDVRRRLQKDPRSFEALARTASKAPEAPAGGLMGTFSRGQLPPEIEAAAAPLPTGVISDVVHSPFGYHIFRVDARETARQRSFDECRGEIRALLLREGSDHSVRQFVQGLMARAKVNHEAAKAPSRDS